jgi:homopolymeric O-antigen transport system ATP-binding protein
MSSSAYPPGLDDTVIKAQNLGKLYHLYDRPSDRLKHTLFWRFGRTYGRPFWALQDVSFEIKKGETFGIIGKNGSGKSTLLQILAGILTETTGQVSVQGRVGALLELGSGFNPEFSGRENVFLNGMILGIPKKEMEAKYDEIAAFADIGEFIDQPVKLYSSGMFVRLAFAVATGIEADILLIDEALAVGDVFFRQKCYQRLERLRANGVSILLVSHAMNEVEQFCSRALLLDNGESAYLGSAVEAVKRYYLIEQAHYTSNETYASEDDKQPVSEMPQDEHFWPESEAFLDISSVTQVSNGVGFCTGVAITDIHGQPCRVFKQGEMACFFFEFEVKQPIQVPLGGMQIQNDKGLIIHGKTSLEYGIEAPEFVSPANKIRFRQDIFLEIATGEYTFEVGFATIGSEDYHQRNEQDYINLYARVSRICTITGLGPFAVVFRKDGSTPMLRHHGMVNLPGNIQVHIV